MSASERIACKGIYSTSRFVPSLYIAAVTAAFSDLSPPKARAKRVGKDADFDPPSSPFGFLSRVGSLLALGMFSALVQYALSQEL